jgi:hypothetical protein
MASKRSKSRPNRRSKSAPKPAGINPTTGRNAKPAETPAIPPRPESPWLDGEVSPEASPLTLAAGLLEDFESDSPFVQSPALDLLARALRAAADDCELASTAQDGGVHGSAIGRVLTRIESRSRIVIEIARRMIDEERAS